jgi:hypothetical protein
MVLIKAENMIPQETLALEQKVFLKGFQRFEIHASGDLELTFKQFLTHRQFKIPLWQIVPNPERVKHRQIGNVIGIGVFGLFILGLATAACFSEKIGLVIALGIPIMILLAFVFICMWQLQAQSVNAMFFELRQGGQLSVWFEKPDAKSFHAFCETLTMKAEEAWQNRPVESSQSLAGEIAALKKLVDVGTISEAEFHKAKEKLINSAEGREIGFR